MRDLEEQFETAQAALRKIANGSTFPIRSDEIAKEALARVSSPAKGPQVVPMQVHDCGHTTVGVDQSPASRQEDA